MVGWVMENGEPVIVNNPRQDWRFFLQVDEDFSFHTRSILCVPVLRKDQPIGVDEIIGVIELVNKDQPGFSEADVTLALILSDIATAALEGTPLPVIPVGMGPPNASGQDGFEF